MLHIPDKRPIPPRPSQRPRRKQMPTKRRQAQAARPGHASHFSGPRARRVDDGFGADRAFVCPDFDDPSAARHDGFGAAAQMENGAAFARFAQKALQQGRRIDHAVERIPDGAFERSALQGVHPLDAPIGRPELGRQPMRARILQIAAKRSHRNALAQQQRAVRLEPHPLVPVRAGVARKSRALARQGADIGVWHHLADHLGAPARGMIARGPFLLENDNIPGAGFGQAPGRGRAGQPGANDDIRSGFHHFRLSKESRRRSGKARDAHKARRSE
ncbi:MAG: hypothetical protein BWZ10_02258 [candidate division BRC1 bacterium ADurb.BinA364]|nr:MAG: hypothetical protein BWZ10_02258 [candidate division BRC1 bacterium ADurb.BinA364]